MGLVQGGQSEEVVFAVLMKVSYMQVGCRCGLPAGQAVCKRSYRLCGKPRGPSATNRPSGQGVPHNVAPGLESNGGMVALAIAG